MVVSAEDYRMDPDNILAIHRLAEQAPKTAAEFHWLLGFLSYQKYTPGKNGWTKRDLWTPSVKNLVQFSINSKVKFKLLDMVQEYL